MTNKEHMIRFLQSLPENEDVCILVFSRGDAEGFLPPLRLDSVTDAEWESICADFNNNKPNDSDWDDFGDIVSRNLRENQDED